MTDHLTHSPAGRPGRSGPGHLPTACLVIALGGLSLAEHVQAQDQESQAVAQPRDLNLGSLRKDARVEANIVVFWNDRSKLGKPVKVEPPPFVRVTRFKSSMHKHLGATTGVWFSVATNKPGAAKGTLRVRCDGATVKVLMQAVVLPRDPISTRVLVAKTPFDGYSIQNSSLLASWRRVVDTGKLEVHYLNVPEKGSVFGVKTLQRADVVIIADECLVKITRQDVALLQGFVCGGGRLIVAADHFFQDTVAKANELVTAFGLRMHDTEPRGPTSYEIGDDVIARHRLTRRVTSIKVKRPSPISITDDRQARVLVPAPGFPERALIAVSRTESGGELVALGKSLWWLWGSAGPGNERLLRNLLTRKRR